MEDELSVREITALFLREMHFEVLEAGSIQDALDVERSHPAAIDLLITDLHLGSDDGRALAREITQLRPQVRVLYTSGYDDEQVPPQDRQRFLSKPYLISDLRRITTALLD